MQDGRSPPPRESPPIRILPSRLWTELATVDFAAADMAAHVAVLPLAATEQHGPHLPLGTDTFIMEGFLTRVLARLPADRPIVVLPTQTIGVSVEHTDFPGTLSLPAGTALAAWTDLIAAVARAGFRKIVIVSSHGGNSAPIDLVAHACRAELGLLVVMASWQRFGYPPGLFDDAEIKHGIHGGAIETSLMLAFRPDLVRMDQARDFRPAGLAMEQDFAWLNVGRPSGFGWMARDLCAAGVAGDATAATAAKGQACAEHGAGAFVELLRDVESFDLARLAPAAEAP